MGINFHFRCMLLQEITKYGADEMAAACKIQYHPSLNRAFIEAGLTISDNRITGGD